MSDAFAARGWNTLTVDWDERFDVDLHADIGTLTMSDILDLTGGVRPDVIWASPDCTTYSLAAIGHHRYRDPMGSGILLPKTEYAARCDRIDMHMVRLMRDLNPVYWFIENPVGGMKDAAFTRGLPRYMTTYCQWAGDRVKRRKPTFIWSNHPWLATHPLPACRNGDPCHVAAPRGSKTGTQGLGNHVERSRIPTGFCEFIAGLCDPLPTVKPLLRLDPRPVETNTPLF